MILTADELELLTAKTERAQKRYSSQERVLQSLRIPFQRRPDGTLIVFRRHVDGQTTQGAEQSPALCLP